MVRQRKTFLRTGDNSEAIDPLSSILQCFDNDDSAASGSSVQ